MQQIVTEAKSYNGEIKSFEILAVGTSKEVSQAIAAWTKKNKDVVVDLLETDPTETDAPFPDVRLTHSNYTADLLSGYDLIIFKSIDTTLAHTVQKDAHSKGIIISILNGNVKEHSIEANHLPGATSGKPTVTGDVYWKSIANKCLFALAFIILGHVVSSYYPLHNITNAFRAFAVNLDLDAAFGWMVLAGFVAQMVDGALGMGYGVISTTVLLSTGLNPAAISGSIHTAEMFSSGASGYSHYRFGNINKKLFKTLLLPGVLGAVAGAVLLSYLGEEYGSWLRPILSVYTLLLGLRILTNAFKQKRASQKVKHAGWLAGAGGFLDSFGGGGWGPLVTSTLISKGKTPRYIIGTVSLTEFFVTLGSALTFFLILGTSHIQTIAGLIIGGLLAAPLAAKLAGRLKTKPMLISVGTLVIISSIRTLWKTLSAI
ncbi:sulfite exporter TauE/SafE family protein [Arcticibacter eurypsychrophilus]|uniref:sulfite exporter TauE/SafE family protein n=1 Tax=Arcticibacter eurypsychrophilus TaxID=1434752 RepID=UPI0009F1DFF2|nr:sulfite exporter TauE/SafE family protein [Arcticibacter eurypsychrophilus]